MKVNPKIFPPLAIFMLLVLFTSFVVYRKKFQYQSYCPEPVLANFKAGKIYGHPNKVVVQPWNGRHNVYAIFMLPNEIKRGKTLIVNIPGGGTYCGAMERVGTSFEGVEAEPGHYLVKASLRTRTSTLLIARGFLKQLKDPRNWNLV
jgi:hypothetical protein